MPRPMPPCPSAARKASWVSTRCNSQAISSLRSSSRMSSASLGSSSRERIRRGWVRVTSSAPGRGRVDHRPEHAKLLDGIDELVKVYRLDHVGIHAELVAGDQILLFMR